MPDAEVNVVAEPRALDDESVLERVMVIARNRALAVHHVTVHEIRGRLSISLDLEVDGKLSLGAAHEIADGLEAASRENSGPDVEVETHIEPLQPADASGRDAPPERGRGGARCALAEIAAAGGMSATSTMCGCAKPMKARSSTSTAASTHRSRVQAVHEKVDEARARAAPAFAARSSA